jgi:hypothetical protein
MRRREIMNMRCIVTSCAILAVCVSSLAESQVQNPTFVNIYWVADGGTAATWDSDVQSTATGSGTLFNTTPAVSFSAEGTIDFIDGLVMSITQSKYLGLESAYGVTGLTDTMLPSIVVDTYAQPPQDINDVDSKIGDLINWLVSNNSSLKPSNVVFNFFIPPWVGASDPTTDWCSVTGTQGSAPGHNAAWNSSANGHSYTVIPTNAKCGNCSGISIAGSVSHEMVEATSGDQNAADDCHNNGLLSEFPFLKYFIARFDNHPSDGTCLPDAGQVPALTAPTNTKVCGSGQSMVMQAIVDPRNAPPWDLPSQTNGFGSSMYTGVGLPAGNDLILAGFRHFSDRNTSFPLSLGTTKWSQASSTAPAFVEIDGLGDFYGSVVNTDANSTALAEVSPGGKFQLFIYDPVWGQLNGDSVNGISLTSEAPQYLQMQEFYNWRPNNIPGPESTGMINGNVLGSQNCGLPNHIVGQLPVAGVTVMAKSDDLSDGSDGVIGTSVSDKFSGNVFFEYTPLHVGQRTVTFSVPQFPAVVSQQIQVDVYPVVTQISPSQGFKTTQLTLTVPGLPANATASVTFGPDLATPSAPQPAIVQAGQVQVNAPASPTGALGEVNVAVNVAIPGGSISSNYVKFTYVDPGFPYLKFSPGKNLCGNRYYSEPVQATIYDATGQINPWLGEIDLTGTPPVTESPTSVSNDGAAGSVSETTTDTSQPKPYQVIATGHTSGNQTKMDVPFFQCGLWVWAPIVWDGPLWGLPGPNPVSYKLVNGNWVNPLVVDPEAWAEPTIEQVTSVYAQNQFALSWLTQAQIWGYRSLGPPFFSTTAGASGTMMMMDSSKFSTASSSQDAGVTLTVEAVPTTRPSGSNLCFTGAGIGVSVKNNPAPNWDVKIAFPLNPSIPAGSYRVFGLSAAENVWVEMASTISGNVLTTDAVSADPARKVASPVTGPYVLAFYSNSRCLP